MDTIRNLMCNTVLTKYANLKAVQQYSYKKIINTLRHNAEEVRTLLKNRSHRQAISKMKEIIVAAAEKKNIQAVGAAFIICGLIEYYFKDYASACEYWIELVNF